MVRSRQWSDETFLTFCPGLATLCTVRCLRMSLTNSTLPLSDTTEHNRQKNKKFSTHNLGFLPSVLLRWTTVLLSLLSMWTVLTSVSVVTAVLEVEMIHCCPISSVTGSTLGLTGEPD